MRPLLSLRTAASFALLPLLASTTLGAEEKGPQRFAEMDYGPFLTASFANSANKTVLDGTGCVANKAMAVKLGANAEAAMLFDTECLRMAGGWTGGWIRLRGVVFDGKHGPNPAPPENAEIFFQTNPGPVWSQNGSFADPRPLPSGPGAAKVPLGPLPGSWAKYRGLYLNGQKVVFSYTVGSAALLEMADLETVSGTAVLTRTFNVTQAGAASSLILAEGQNGATSSIANGVATLSGDGKEPEKSVLIALKNAPKGAELQADGGRVILKLPDFAPGQAFKVTYAKGASAEAETLATAAKAVAAPADLTALTKGGPAHWTETVTTKGTLASTSNEPYVLDTIEVPLENPYKSWMRLGGLDFFADGRAVITTWSGDVWVVSGLDRELSRVTWKRYATGIFHALGVKVVDGKIYVLGRDQITRLSDLNGDGEADYYENFNNEIQITPNFHEFAFDLQTDAQGNFYFTKGGPVNPGGRGWGPLSNHHGCVFKVSKDGQKLELLATGIRAPNGMGVGPNGEITVGDNQGTWVPACYLHWVKPGQFISVTDLAHQATPPAAHSPHICYFPMSVDNSSGGQTWVTSDQWGPMKGRLLHLTYGKSGLLGVLMEEVNGVPQGGAFRFPFKFDSGAMRARFHPKDGQLYVVGLKGWQTDGAKESAFQRVRYTGAKCYFPEELHVTDAGIQIAFANPLDAASAGDLQNYAIEQYNYRWTKEYGSADYKVSNPEEKGRDPVEIQAVQLSADRRSVFLQIAGLKPVDQMEITLNLKGEDGSPVIKKITNTINVAAPEKAPGKTYRASLP